MIFSMDEIGFENNEKIIGLKTGAKKWAFIVDVAKAYGFDGIHITPSLYKTFGLDTNNIPFSLREFHLSYHFGGLAKILTDDDGSQYEKALHKAFDTAIRYGMKDISLHPPVIEGFSKDEKAKSAVLFAEIVSRWSETARENHFTLSLETHLYEPYFLFGKLQQYMDFYLSQKDMGILIDISHNYFSGYSEQDILDTFKNRNVTALHISDALRLRDDEIKLGTHLAVGEGKIDFGALLPHFSNGHVFAVLEIKSTNAGVKSSLEMLRRML